MESVTSERRLRTQERRRQVWELRVRGYSQTRIAAILEVPRQTVSDDCRAAYKVWERHYAEEARQQVHLMQDRLDDLLTLIRPKLEQADLEAVDRALAILDRYAPRPAAQAGDQDPFEQRLQQAIDAVPDPPDQADVPASQGGEEAS